MNEQIIKVKRVDIMRLTSKSQYNHKALFRTKINDSSIGICKLGLVFYIIHQIIYMLTMFTLVIIIMSCTYMLGLILMFT